MAIEKRKSPVPFSELKQPGEHIVAMIHHNDSLILATNKNLYAIRDNGDLNLLYLNKEEGYGN